MQLVSQLVGWLLACLVASLVGQSVKSVSHPVICWYLVSDATFHIEQVKAVLFRHLLSQYPFTMAFVCNTCSAFSCWNIRFMCSNPIRGMNVFLLLSVSVLASAVRGLGTGRSPAQALTICLFKDYKPDDGTSLALQACKRLLTDVVMTS